MSSIVATSAPLNRVSGDGNHKIGRSSGDMPRFAMENASLHLSTSSNRPSNDKFSWQSSERQSSDRHSHEKADGVDRHDNHASLSASKTSITGQWDAPEGQALNGTADGPRLQKGSTGIFASGSYIVNTGSRSGNDTAAESGLAGSVDGKSRAEAASPDTHRLEISATPRSASESKLAIDGKDEPVPAANGSAIKPGSPLDSPRRTSMTTSSARKRRAHSASNSDGPHMTSLQLESTPNSSNRLSSPPYDAASSLKPMNPPSPQHPRLQHRHTLQVPRTSTQRGLREFSWTNASEDALSTAINPNSAARRASLNLVRRTTRSAHSELDDVPQDADAARWAEKIHQKRMSRHRRKEEEEDDRVMVGTKVDQNHVNWVTAYNMLTGIRFTVSRTNAKLDRELTDADFEARHKFSFDITGNELTPSAKYDFKFKDYAPWVFRHLRAQFHLDPADYLISLTSKYILSELGSPGKSGSFFYFSRDYKYIIKTIHHSEHKMLRKVLKEYYNHVMENPNTLISQFYGLHRVKIPRGRKIHFVVMNNLFPPHRDIHSTFDLKGSTIGRDFKEEELAKNPRATLKDLNWIRRNNHLELGPVKKRLFMEQMGRDVALLQKLHIMDYSLLVGIHDVSKGNDENLRDKTLQVFQPGGDDAGDNSQRDNAVAGGLARTPSKQEKARKARELRQAIKRERPVPMDKSTLGMPDNVLDAKKNFFFYSDDGGFRASHDDDSPGEEIYYLGIIDCLTHYGFIKRIENFLKGMSGHESQISPVPPQFYGERFLKFISGTTMPREEAEQQRSITQDPQGNVPIIKHSSNLMDPETSQDLILERAEREAAKGSRDGTEEEKKSERTLTTTRTPSVDRGTNAAGTTLPVLEEVGEGGSVGGRSVHSSRGNLRENQRGEMPDQAPANTASPQQKLSPPLGGRPPPTPPKDPPQEAAPMLPTPTFVDSPITLEPN